MKRSTKILGFTLAALIPIFCTAVYAISCMNAGHGLSWEEFTNGLIGRVSNCGGNSAAGSTCRNIALMARVVGDDSNNILNFKQLPQDSQNELGASIRNNWTSDAKYLLRAGAIHTGPGTHEIVVVCDTAYGNEPQPTIWNLHHRTMRHAAGYSDGSIGWLTPAEFDALNKSNFFEFDYKPKAIGSLTNSNPFE